MAAIVVGPGEVRSPTPGYGFSPERGLGGLHGLVDQRLHPPPDGLEDRGDGQGGGGHGQTGAVGQQPAEPQHHGGVGQAEQDREQPVG
jgi:hypothetical protein